jgi:hypothetical protein
VASWVMPRPGELGRGHQVFQSMLVLAMVTSKLEGRARRVPSGDGNGVGWA